MKKFFLVLSLFTLVLLGGCMPLFNNSGDNKATNNNTGTKENKVSQLTGAYKFIGFVATFCPHCQTAVPKLEKFYEEHPGVNMELNVLDKKKFENAKKLPQNYTNPKQYQDYTNEPCGYVPSYVIVDKNNKVIDKKCGGSPTIKELEKYLLSNEKNNNSSKQKSEVVGKDTKKNNLTNKKQTMTDRVRLGDTIEVNYIGIFADGKVFDTSLEDEARKAGIYNSVRDYKPLKFTVGAGQMIPCFDKGVIDMKVGETKEITCQPEEAYGNCDETKIQTVKKEQLKQFEEHGYKIEKGTQLPTQYGMIKIKDVKGDDVILDLNNPMCGKVLKFKVTVVKIDK